jgi:hypothetical protein
MITNNRYDFKFNVEDENHCVCKLPSGLCHTAAQNSVKKVFLYRNLGEHLVKVYNFPDYNASYLEHYFPYALNVRHPELKKLSLDTDIKKHIFMWANNILWLKDSLNVFWVKSSDFFNKIETITQDVCCFFEIPPVVNYSISTIHVKQAKLNKTEQPLSEIEIPPERKYFIGRKFGIIPKFVYEEDEEIMEGCDWLLQHVPSLTPYVLN